MNIWLALDIGERRIGLAAGGESSRLARPVGILSRRNKREDLEAVARFASDVGATHLLVGLPLNMDGSEGDQAERVRRLARHIERRLSLPTVYWDERLSSFAADEILQEIDQRKRRPHNDDVAAATILQSYFDR